MTYFKNTTDSSGVYAPNSASGSNDLNGAAVGGNLSDIMKNNTVFRIKIVTPNTLRYEDSKTSTALTDIYGVSSASNF